MAVNQVKYAIWRLFIDGGSDYNPDGFHGDNIVSND